jgi:hypothetical protein
MVIMDGEGLGHTPSSFSSLSTSITKKFNMVDAIILVDNAAQPMQATTTAALSDIVSGGHESKLSICFTHFDDMTGANFMSTIMKKNHIYNSVESAISLVGKTLGKRAENSLKKVTATNTFYLAGIDVELNERKKFTIKELNGLLDSIKLKVQPKDITEIHPVYDIANLLMSIKSALVEFHEPWRAKIGLVKRSDIAPEHWARIKALTRRLGVLGEDEYADLKPVADLIRLLKEHVYVFICMPIRFRSTLSTEEQQSEAIARIANEIDIRLHKWIPEILFKSRVPNWNKAFYQRGAGSTYLRAQEIRSIYDTSVPIPGEIPSIDSNKFINELRTLIENAIKDKQGFIS